MIADRPPVPRSAHRLVLFALDGGRCADPAVRRHVEDAIATTMSRIEACPGAADHQFAAVVYGADLVRAVPPGAPRPWDLREPGAPRLWDLREPGASWPWDLREPGAGPGRTDGATAAVADLAERFLSGTPDGLPGGVDVLALVEPGARMACPDDLRILLSAVDDPAALADEWWARLAEMRSQRRHTVLLK